MSFVLQTFDGGALAEGRRLRRIGQCELSWRQAGERFFERLDKVRRAGEGKAELLEIYYLCMALGFEGKYKIAGPAKVGA